VAAGKVIVAEESVLVDFRATGLVETHKASYSFGVVRERGVWNSLPKAVIGARVREIHSLRTEAVFDRAPESGLDVAKILLERNRIVVGIFALLLALPSVLQGQPVVKNTFSPNSATISTSEGAPYGDCDFWTATADSCSHQSNFGYGPTKIMRLYICLSGEVRGEECSRQPAVNSPLSPAMLNKINVGIAAYAGTGIRLLLRFIYNYGPIGPTGRDAPLSVILTHIDQLAPVLLENQDLIFALEAGFVGTWGEWHHSTNGNNSVAQAFTQLGQDLTSGNLQAAQRDYANLQQDVQQAGQLNASQQAAGHHHHHHHGRGGTQPTSSASSSQQNSVNQAFSTLGQDLQAGNLSGAQSAFATLQNDLQQIGGFLPATGTSGITSATAPASAGNLNVTA